MRALHETRNGWRQAAGVGWQQGLNGEKMMATGWQYDGNSVAMRCPLDGHIGAIPLPSCCRLIAIPVLSHS